MIHDSKSASAMFVAFHNHGCRNCCITLTHRVDSYTKTWASRAFHQLALTRSQRWLVSKSKAYLHFQKALISFSFRNFSSSSAGRLTDIGRSLGLGPRLCGGGECQGRCETSFSYIAYWLASSGRSLSWGVGPIVSRPRCVVRVCTQRRRRR